MNRYAFVEKAVNDLKPKAEVIKAKPRKRSLKKRASNSRTLAADRMRQAALMVFQDPESSTRRSRSLTPRRNTVSRSRFQPPATVCMTGPGPRTRSELVDILEEYGFRYTQNPNRADILVFNPDHTASESTKFARARRNSEVALVTYDLFFRDFL